MSSSAALDDSFRARPHLVSRQDRPKYALPVLLEARALVKAGWCQGAMQAVDSQGNVRVSLSGALATGDLIEGEWARRIVRRLCPAVSLKAFNDHPSRRKGEVVHLLDRAIEECGGEPRASRGGWRCTARAPALPDFPKAGGQR